MVQKQLDLAVPNWVKSLPNRRAALKLDSQQFVIQVVVNNVLALGVMHISSYTILLDTKMADSLGISVQEAKPAVFGYYIVPRALQLHMY